MEVRQITADEFGLFDALANKCGSLFNTTMWTSLFSPFARSYGIYTKSGSLVGGFSIYLDHRWGLRILRNPPFTPTCGPFIELQATHPTSVAETRRKVLEAMALFLDRNSFAVVSLPLSPGIEDTLPFFWRRFKVIPNYTYILDLKQEDINLESGMSTTRRNDVTKARRDGLEARQIDDLSIVRVMVQRTFARKKKRVNLAALDAILHSYANPTNSFAVGAFRNDSILACCFIIYDGRAAYYLLGARDERRPHHGAGALALFEALCIAQRLGLERFDFEGSTVPAIERYFRGFGGRLTPYFTINKGWLALEMALKLYKRELF